MKTLENWLAEQFTQRKVEPNSGLGQAIAYMRKHWQPLTLPLAQSQCAPGQQRLKCRQRHFRRYADCRIMPRHRGEMTGRVGGSRIFVAARFGIIKGFEGSSVTDLGGGSGRV